MDSLSRHEAMRSAGYGSERAHDHVDALTTHACVCRTRADNTDRPAFRDFVAAASDRTRCGREMSNLRSNHDREDRPVHAAACEALFDLIMDGV